MRPRFARQLHRVLDARLFGAAPQPEAHRGGAGPVPGRRVVEQLHAYSHRLFDAVDYVGLGTCEFMVTDAGKVYFLEVNPRLQVEHTVSEEVSGLDLVREQLQIAAGGKVSPEPTARGHSFELRITSEDPKTNLTPAPARSNACSGQRDPACGWIPA